VLVPAVGMWILGRLRRGFQSFKALDISLRGAITGMKSAFSFNLLELELKAKRNAKIRDVHKALLGVYSFFCGVLSRFS